jgi:hypothetical protein
MVTTASATAIVSSTASTTAVETATTAATAVETAATSTTAMTATTMLCKRTRRAKQRHGRDCREENL